MRFELLLFVCLACLALTAQAAPTTGRETLLEQKLGQHGKSKPDHRTHRPTHRSHHQPTHNLQHKPNLHHAADPKRKRNPPPVEAESAVGAAEHLLSETKPTSEINPDVEAALQDELAKKQKAARDKAAARMHTMQVKDALHVAEYGQTPSKFPTITRISAMIGLSAAAVNVVNFMFSAKTTALATTQFSAPPTPPTLLDSAALWDGRQYRLMPLPEDPDSKDSASSGKKEKRSVEDRNKLAARMQKRTMKRKKPAISLESDSSKQADGKQRAAGKKTKRWLTAAVVGAAVGAAVSPGLPSTIFPSMKPEHQKPPFNPYDPRMLEPKDAFSAAAADPDRPLPVPQPDGVSGNGYGPPHPYEITFPTLAYSYPATSNTQRQPTTGYPYQDSSAPSVGSTYEGSSSAEVTQPESQPVLRKRAVVSAQRDAADAEPGEPASKLDKRFLFTGGPWAKLAGGVTVGSVLPLVYGGVSHARYRTMNPRDRDILKDLENKPMYGAVGVPGNVPGQLATEAMPGFTEYIESLEAQQAQQQMQAQAVLLQQRVAQRQAQILQAQQSRLAQPASGSSGIPMGSEASGGAATTAAEPVLRKRKVEEQPGCPHGVSGGEGSRNLSKRGNFLFGTSMVTLGALLGYFQSATQFPTDRDEDKEAKKREREKERQQQMAQMQMQGGQPPGYGPADASAVGGAAQKDMYASVPIQPLGSSSAGDGLPPLAGGVPSPFAGASGSVYGGGASLSSLGPGGSNNVLTTASGNADNSGDSGPSTSAMLNSAAGYQTTGGSGASHSILKKRDTSAHSEQSLSKRAPGFGTALSIGSTFMFGGTLLGNLFVSSKQKDKPVPLVTPNANTFGPMIPGVELYTAYLEAKRGQKAGAGAGGAGMAPSGAPASLPYPGSSLPAVRQTYNVADSSFTDATAGAGSGMGTVAGARADPAVYGGSNVDQGAVEPENSNPVLKKRNAPSIAAETLATALLEEAPVLSKASTSAASLLTKTPAIPEAASGAAASAGRLGRLSPMSGAAGDLTRTEAGFAGLGRASMLGEGGTAAATSALRADSPMLGTARPAMISNLRTAGGAGTPATIDGLAGRTTLGGSASAYPLPLPGGYGTSSLQATLQAQQRAAAGEVTAAQKGGVGGTLAVPQVNSKSKVMDAVNLVGAGAGATMMFSGIG